MKITTHDRVLAPKKNPRTGGRKPDPNSIRSQARELGLNHGTSANRLKAVEAGKITLEEAKTLPIRSRYQCGKMAAKARWGGAK